MASEQRRRRVEHLMQRALAQIITREMDDPFLGMPTISAVEVSRDFSYARVYVSLFNSPDEAEGLAHLRKRAGRLRHRLGQVLDLRSLPELRFQLDETIERGQRLSRLIDEAVSGAKKDEEQE